MVISSYHSQWWIQEGGGDLSPHAFKMSPNMLKYIHIHEACPKSAAPALQITLSEITYLIRK